MSICIKDASGTQLGVLYQCAMRALGGHHSISRGGWSFCRGRIIYFNPARRRAENFKLYYMFIEHRESARNYLLKKNPDECTVIFHGRACGSTFMTSVSKNNFEPRCVPNVGYAIVQQRVSPSLKRM